jgi:hypothetical protein
MFVKLSQDGFFDFRPAVTDVIHRKATHEIQIGFALSIKQISAFRSRDLQPTRLKRSGRQMLQEKLTLA